MELTKIVDWLDRTLEVDKFDDASNNGVQIWRKGKEVKVVAFAVDASVRTINEAARCGAHLLVVHHGISWGGGIKRITGGIYSAIKVAMDADMALYACHLPLDAHEKLGNNWNLAHHLGLKRLSKAFNYHGNVIGVIGYDGKGRKIGVCSGGAGEFAEEAKKLGCEEFVTGEADWGEVIAAENCGMKMKCLGHYETETFGVSAVAKEMNKVLKVKTMDLTEKMR